MIKHEWFTIAEAAAIWGAKDGVAGMVRLILEGDDQRLSASYVLPTPWKAYYIKRIEEPSADPQKWFSPETKEVWRVDIEVTGLVELYFSGNCSNADNSITIRGDGSVKNDWPSQIYISLPGSSITSSLHLISTGETPEELQDCLNIEPEQDLVITRKQLESFARTVGRSSVLAKLKSLPISSNIATCEILIEFESRIDIERKPRQTHDLFDIAKSKKKYCVPEGHEPVRLASTSGHVLIVNEEPRYIMAGFEQEAIAKGCMSVENGVEVQEETQNTTPAKKKKRSAEDPLNRSGQILEMTSLIVGCIKHLSEANKLKERGTDCFTILLNEQSSLATEQRLKFLQEVLVKTNKKQSAKYLTIRKGTGAEMIHSLEYVLKRFREERKTFFESLQKSPSEK